MDPGVIKHALETLNQYDDTTEFFTFNSEDCVNKKRVRALSSSVVYSKKSIRRASFEKTREAGTKKRLVCFHFKQIDLSFLDIFRVFELVVSVMLLKQ